MSEEIYPGRPSVPEPGDQSQRSAADDELADSFDLDAATERFDAAAGDPPAVSSSSGPDGPGATASEGRNPDADATRAIPPAVGPMPPVSPAPADQPARLRRPNGSVDPSRFEAFDAAARGDAGKAGKSGGSGGSGGAAPPDGGVPLPSGRRSTRRRVEKMTRRRRKAPWWELPLLVGFAILVAVLVKSFVVQPFFIPSQSMERTLHGCPGCKGDRILVNKPIYHLRDPHPGDIVVFNAPPGWDDEVAPTPPSNPVVRAVHSFGQLVGVVPPDGLVLVKRVIAVGGQTVKGDAQGHVLVSDSGPAGPYRTLNEPYVFTDGADSHAEFGPVTVPKGRLWVMGDHRNDSADSRFHCGSDGAEGPDGPTCDATSATVPNDLVIGKAVVIAWPPSRWRTLGTPKTFSDAAGVVGPALPAVGSAVAVVPFFVVRRARRRRRR